MTTNDSPISSAREIAEFINDFPANKLRNNYVIIFTFIFLYFLIILIIIFFVIFWLQTNLTKK